MNKIPSFTINHLTLMPGVYVSRKDQIGQETITTFDVRMKAPNRESVMSTGICHTIEHLGATLLRNDKEWSDRVIYWGPMGCRTGFYLVMAGDVQPMEIQELLIRVYDYAANYEGEIPGASARDCGNYSDMDLHGCHEDSCKFLKVLKNLNEATTNYPD